MTVMWEYGCKSLDTNNGVETIADRVRLCDRMLLKLVLTPKNVSITFLNLAGVGWNEKEGEVH